MGRQERRQQHRQQRGGGPGQRSIRAAARELALIAGVYVGYSIVRNRFGSARVSPKIALDNARTIIDLERSLGIYNEAAIQRFFIDHVTFIQFWNLYYGLFHFLVTCCVLIWAFFALGDRFVWWRSTLLGTTVVALVGYAAFPLMPPRLLTNCGTYGACLQGEPAATAVPADLVFVDSVTEIGGIWSFESEAIETVTNHYAAMPSLHVGWALWVLVVMIGARRSRTAIAATFGHLFATIFGIVVTANHYWLDVLGGVVVVGTGVGIAWVLSKVSGLRVRPAN